MCVVVVVYLCSIWGGGRTMLHDHASAAAEVVERHAAEFKDMLLESAPQIYMMGSNNV